MTADLLLKNGMYVNPLSGEVYQTDISIKDGKIFGYDSKIDADKILDIAGKYVTPGFIEGHIHIESSHLEPENFFEVAVKNGITTLVCDPHEIANVAGIIGIEYLIEKTKKLPINFFFMAPSCVPASKFESNGEKLGIKDLKKLKKNEKIIGLGEVMNFPGVIEGNDEVLKKIGLYENMIIDGHAPSVTGSELDTYIRNGILSDHETISMNEAREKIRKGMYLMIRNSSSAKNLNLIKIINNKNSSRFMIVSDDRSPEDLYKNNFILDSLRTAKNKYNKPLDILIKGVTINPAQYFNFKKIGALVPGYDADILVFDDIDNFDLSMTIAKGNIVYRDGEFLSSSYKINAEKEKMKKYFNLSLFNKKDFHVKDKNKKVKIIKVLKDSIYTEYFEKKLDSRNGNLKIDIDNDILKISCINRYKKNKNYYTGFVNGIKLKKGAIASSYNHDSHNIVVVGSNEKDMAIAVNRLNKIGGGIVFVKNEKIVTELPLSVYGIISNLNLKEVSQLYTEIELELRKNGVKLNNPLSIISFLSLSVIPELKINDKGLVNVNKFQIEGLYV